MRITEGEGGRLGKGRLSMAGLVPARDHRDRLEQHRPSSCRRHRRRNHRRHPSHRGRHHRSRHTHHRDHRNLDDRLLIHRDLTFKKLISTSIEPVDVNKITTTEKITMYLSMNLCFESGSTLRKAARILQERCGFGLGCRKKIPVTNPQKYKIEIKFRFNWIFLR